MTTATLDYGIPRLNEKGYRDPTAYQALKLVQQAEFGNRPLTYICSPYSGDVEANVELARDLSAYAVDCQRIPLAPHLLFPQFMDDTDPWDRELAMFFNRVLLSKCEAMWVYTPRVSLGMKTEIGWAHQFELPITYFDHNFAEVELHD
ncbi:MAG: DUF4406 domain-containing protein [Actinomycetaceae bacterium]|nr:DUF4406 domain-containing protein [Actinomycetaceae bacterium]